MFRGIKVVAVCDIAFQIKSTGKLGRRQRRYGWRILRLAIHVLLPIRGRTGRGAADHGIGIVKDRVAGGQPELGGMPV